MKVAKIIANRHKLTSHQGTLNGPERGWTRHSLSHLLFSFAFLGTFSVSAQFKAFFSFESRGKRKWLEILPKYLLPSGWTALRHLRIHYATLQPPKGNLSNVFHYTVSFGMGGLEHFDWLRPSWCTLLAVYNSHEIFTKHFHITVEVFKRCVDAALGDMV